jgi:threonylcarbamoyladenosine tRNA methylthiotransferase CDKAL1
VRVYVEAYGCAQNLGEAEDLRRAALSRGHELAGDPSEADVGVLVTCAVIGSTEDRMVERWDALSRALPHTIVTGCLVPLRQQRLVADGARGQTHLLPIRAQERLPELLDELASAQPRTPSAGHGLPMLSAPPPLPVAHRELVLAQGCTSHCTYCYSRLARGPLESTPKEVVLARAARALADGASELRMSSLDTSCWGEETGPDGPRLPGLVRAVAALPCERDFRIRVGMMSPQSVLPILSDYLSVLREVPRLFRFLHLPVQSGSDRVLEDMRRGYRVDDFRRIVAAAREAAPDLMLSTDLIVGFPTEQAEDHRATLQLLEEIEPEIVNVTRFSSRPMTPAARLRPLLSREVKRRSREVSSLRLRLARRRMERWIGTEGDAVVLEHGPSGTSVARLPNYLPVVLEGRRPFGEWLSVRITGARSTYLLGTPTSDPFRRSTASS